MAVQIENSITRKMIPNSFSKLSKLKEAIRNQIFLKISKM